jgi:hypothetical protein
MKYFHRTHLSPDAALAAGVEFFGARLTPAEESPRRHQWTGAIGRISLSAQPEGGHYTLVTLATDQVGESEADKLAKRFLTLLHAKAEPGHAVRGAY